MKLLVVSMLVLSSSLLFAQDYSQSFNTRKIYKRKKQSLKSIEKSYYSRFEKKDDAFKIIPKIGYERLNSEKLNGIERDKEHTVNGYQFGLELQYSLTNYIYMATTPTISYFVDDIEESTDQYNFSQKATEYIPMIKQSIGLDFGMIKPYVFGQVGLLSTRIKTSASLDGSSIQDEEYDGRGKVFGYGAGIDITLFSSMVIYGSYSKNKFKDVKYYGDDSENEADTSNIAVGLGWSF